MVSVVIPLYNATPFLATLLESLRQQTVTHELILIDSESTDGTPDLLRQWDISFTTIPNRSFNHGATRNLGVSLAKYDTVIFLTQDALPAGPATLELLQKALMSQDDVAMAYGRQLPYPDADLMSQFARLSNYPDKSKLKSMQDIDTMGIKACHSSNSFAVYRKQDLVAVGGFPSDTILGEDVSVSARLILKGKKVAYCAEATVFHSHNYTLNEEFKRYFDIGVFHKQQQEVLKPFTKAESEGVKYVIREWKFLYQHKRTDLIPRQIVRTGAKYIGYRLGYFFHVLPDGMKRRLSMHRSFWQ